MAVKGGLGKGLDAIFLENDFSEKENSNITMVRVSEIEPNKGQPRVHFEENALLELADSIASKGLLQPLIVRPISKDRYQIVAGERRWRASRMAGLHEVPVIIRDLDDSETMEIALIENLQRKDLSVIEEAKGYKNLMDKYNLTQEGIANAVGKSRSAITNVLRLLKLPDKVINMIENGNISVGHAKVLLSLKTNEQIELLAEEIVKKELSVRQVEHIVQKSLNAKKEANLKENRVTIYDEVEISLRECLGRKIKVKGNQQKKGTIEIEFFGEKDLMGIAELLANIGEW